MRRFSGAWIGLITAAILGMPGTLQAQETADAVRPAHSPGGRHERPRLGQLKREHPNRAERMEGRRDRWEKVRDWRQDRRDRREGLRDRRPEGGPKDRMEDVRDRWEDLRDRREDRRDQRTNGLERRPASQTGGVGTPRGGGRIGGGGRRR